MKKLFAILMSLLLLLGAFAGCSKPSDTPVRDGDATLDNGNTFAESYPIVKTPIVLSCGMTDNGTVGDYEKRSLWKEMKDLTGIDIELRLFTSGGETVSLMFATQEYPDISFRLDTSSTNKLVAEAAVTKGDIVELTDEMLSKYAPNVNAIFNQYPELKKMTRQYDGKIYSLPQMDYRAEAVDLRDCWYINATWLDELGLDTPKTMDDFTEYLRAVKNAAGEGTIPANVSPLYVRHYQNNGGWFSFCDSFGVYNGLASPIVVNGKVQHNAQDPAFKNVIKYLASLFAEGLIDENGLSASYDEYYLAVDGTGTSTATWFVGSYFGYSNINENMTAIPNLKVNDETPVYARQTGLADRFLANCFVIYKNNRNPIASLRYADYFYSTEGALRARYGEEGYFYQKNDDGSYVFTGAVLGQLPDEVRGFENYGPNIITPELDEQLTSEYAKDPTTRTYAFQHYYRDLLPTDREKFPTLAVNYLEEAELLEVNKTSDLIEKYIKTITLKWIKGTENVDDDWDTFQQKLIDLGINKLLGSYQKAYDAYTKAGK